jgi:hypothetical protein
MSDTAELRLFAGVCHALSERARDPDDKACWLRLARKWQQMDSADQTGVSVRLPSPQSDHHASSHLPG